jgi:hypothetical protein
LGDADTSGTSSTEKQSKRQKKRNRKNNFGENSQNLSQTEKKKLLEQQYIKNIAMNVDRTRPIMDDSADEEMHID